MAGPFFPQNPRPIGAVPGGWQHGNTVTYVKYSYDLSSAKALLFNIDGSSGIYPVQGLAGMRKFAVDRANREVLDTTTKIHGLNGLGPAGTINPVVGLNVQMWTKGFVLYELDFSRSWQFRKDDDGIQTDDANNDEYFGLYQAPDALSGKITEKHIFQHKDPNMGTTTGRCRVAFFAAKTPSRKGRPTSTGKSDPDGFNLYVVFPQQDGSDASVILDPDIQNTGVPPNHLTGGGRKSE